MNQETRNLVYLLNCALNGQKADKKQVLEMNLAEVFTLAEYHKVAACVAFALDGIGLDNDTYKPWKQAKSMSVRKNIMLNEERNQIYSYMEDNGIRYVSLKGIVMQNLYPKFGMREMGDNDILYDSAYQEQMYDFMIERGYDAEIHRNYYHDEYTKPPIYNIELHASLFNRSEYPKFYDYYDGIINRLVHVSNKKYELCFSDEDFYIYNIVHSYKHYSTGGTGIRLLTDCYVFLSSKKASLDIEYIENECNRLEIGDYEKNCRLLSLKLFSSDDYNNIEEQLTEDEKKFFNRIIISGVYGRQELGIESKLNSFVVDDQNLKFVKIKYYFSRLFPTIESIKDFYPFFYRHKILIPFLWVYRILRELTVNRKRLKSEIKSVDDTIANMNK